MSRVIEPLTMYQRAFLNKVEGKVPLNEINGSVPKGAMYASLSPIDKIQKFYRIETTNQLGNSTFKTIHYYSERGVWMPSDYNVTDKDAPKLRLLEIV